MTDGVYELLTKLYRYHISKYILTLYFIILDDRKGNEDVLTIVLRKSNLDSDSLGILIDLSNRSKDIDVYLACENKHDLREMIDSLSPSIFDLDLNIKLVSKFSLEFPLTVAKSGYIYHQRTSSTRGLRYVDSSDRQYLASPHGVVTKAVGNYKTNTSFSTQNSFFNKLCRDVIFGVESDMHRFYFSSAKGDDPKNIQKYGQPRFDRIRMLLKDKSEPITSKRAKKELACDSKFRILYAPTQRPYTDKHPFPFTGSELEDLRKYLRQNDIELYIRMHIIEESDNVYEKIVDGETIKYGGHYLAPAVCEILPYFDMLVTDYSSIYVEYLPFDQPIVFFKNDFEEFVQEYGIPYDYDKYFPGKKVEKLEEFTSYIDECRHGNDGYGSEREFVRKTFLPSRKKTYCEQTIL